MVFERWLYHCFVLCTEPFADRPDTSIICIYILEYVASSCSPFFPPQCIDGDWWWHTASHVVDAFSYDLGFEQIELHVSESQNSGWFMNPNNE